MSNSSHKTQLVNDQPKYKDIHEIYTKVLDLNTNYDMDVRDLVFILQQEMNKIDVNNKPTTASEIEKKLNDLFRSVQLMKHPSERMGWNALVSLAKDIQCRFHTISLNAVTKFFLEATYNDNKRKCKKIWSDSTADVKNFMESRDFLLCVQYVKNKTVGVIWIKSNEYKPNTYMLYDELNRKLYHEMLE